MRKKSKKSTVLIPGSFFSNKDQQKNAPTPSCSASSFLIFSYSSSSHKTQNIRMPPPKTTSLKTNLTEVAQKVLFLHSPSRSCLLPAAKKLPLLRNTLLPENKIAFSLPRVPRWSQKGLKKSPKGIPKRCLPLNLFIF